MKLNLTIILIATSITGFAQILNTSKAHTNSVAFLVKHLNNPASYKAVSWSKLEAVYSQYNSTNDAKTIDDQIVEYTTLNAKIDTKIAFRPAHLNKGDDLLKDSIYIQYGLLKKANLKSIDSLNSLRVANSKLYKPHFSHYYLEHTFRARNQFNALVLHQYIFILDKGYKVTDFGDKKEQDMQRNAIIQQLNSL